MKSYTAHIERKPDVMLGKPVFKGTRITIELVLRKLAGGYSFQQLLEAYPQLTTEHLHAAFEYAADFVANEELIDAA